MPSFDIILPNAFSVAIAFVLPNIFYFLESVAASFLFGLDSALISILILMLSLLTTIGWWSLHLLMLQQFLQLISKGYKNRTCCYRYSFDVLILPVHISRSFPQYLFYIIPIFQTPHFYFFLYSLLSLTFILTFTFCVVLSRSRKAVRYSLVHYFHASDLHLASYLQ